MRSNLTDLDDTIAQLGLDGWELVSHSHVENPRIWSFSFKRPIEKNSAWHPG